MNYFTSDFHLGDNLLHLLKRPFESADHEENKEHIGV